MGRSRAAGTVGAGIGDESADGIDLMEARKDESFLADLLAVFDFFNDFEVEKAAQEIHPTIALPDALPEVRGFVAVGVFRVAGGGAVTEVEGEEVGFGAGEAGGHIGRVGIDGEMDQGALFEGEDLFARVAIGAVLMFGVLDGLGSELVLELGSGNRNR